MSSLSMIAKFLFVYVTQVYIFACNIYLVLYSIYHCFIQHILIAIVIVIIYTIKARVEWIG